MVAFGSGLVGRGEWIGVLGERVAAVLPPQSADLAARLWVSIDAGESFEDALDVVLRQGLSGAPSLVLIEAEGDGRVRLLVRGAPVVRVRTARSTVVGESVTEVDSGTATWHEQRFSDVLGVEIEVGVEVDVTEEFGTGLRRLGALHLGAPQGASSRPISQQLPKPVIQAAAPLPATEDATEPDAGFDDAETGTIPAVAPQLAVVPEPEEPAADLAPSVDEETAPLLAPWGASPAPAAAPLAPVAASVETPDLPADAAAGTPVEPELLPGDDTPTGATEVLQVPAPAVTPEAAPSVAPAPTAATRPSGVPRIVFDHGDALDLTGVTVIGRAPSPAASGSADATTFSVPSPLGEVSANHLEVFAGVGPDSDRVVVVDLGSTNGTIVRRDGHSARQLKPRIPVLLSDGDVVDLGDGASFTVVSG